MLLRWTSIIILCLCSACNGGNDKKQVQTKELTKTAISFDTTKWNIKKGLDYPYRAQMLDDILYNDEVRKLNEGEVLKSLGQPDRVNNNHLYYQIYQKRLGVWPLHTRTMVIKIGEDEIVEWIKVNE